MTEATDDMSSPPTKDDGGKVTDRSGNRAKRSPWRLVLRYLVLFPVIVYLGLAAVMFAFQSRIVFVQSKKMQGDPSNAGMAFEDLTLRTSDGVSINAWYVPGPEEARGTALFCHGNGGNMSHCVDRIRLLRELGFNVLLFDYRGYGRSEGTPSEEGLYRDTRAAWDWLVMEKNVPPDEIVLWGHSLGTAVASQLAGEVQAAALIMEASHTSVAEEGQRRFPWLPVRLLAYIELDNCAHVARAKCPVMIVHSSQDQLVPLEFGRRVFDAAREPKAFLEITGGHNSGYRSSGKVYRDGVVEFLKKHVASYYSAVSTDATGPKQR